MIYNLGIRWASFLLKLVSRFNHKLQLGVLGRAETFQILKDKLKPEDQTLWFHCASLGEYEQGLPVFQEIKKTYPNHKAVLTFFSPSGYEIRKNSPIADVVVYLPWDTPLNAKKFIDLVNPDLTIFVKYDIWPNYLKELKTRGKRALLISALFRPNQAYFKWYGNVIKEALFAFEHIFTQDANSKVLLNKIGYEQATISGDTRFDRVSQQLNIDNHLPYIETFKNNRLCVVAGSTWPEGEAFLAEFINSYSNEYASYIIAPHNIKSEQIQKLKASIHKPTMLFSEMEESSLSNQQVFIVDTIGILSKIYSVGDIAYVGGAVGTTGLHNTLEPAVFGIPIIIGSHYDKFPEAHDMVDLGGMFSIKTQEEFSNQLKNLIENESLRNNSGAINKRYIEKNKGAVIQIMDYIRKY
ncbi:glycosyltransferase N-terminal domain-containing protein [Mangrovimonas sp. ST2L15]|uniref:3-deoxy-D-manno-octulosonic acid transferase n=1 Tax=Mangrovimonas sp. ST2L15 TaxID=1645916 RepID=UPI0006B3FF34